MFDVLSAASVLGDQLFLGGHPPRQPSPWVVSSVDIKASCVGADDRDMTVAINGALLAIFFGILARRTIRRRRSGLSQEL